MTIRLAPRITGLVVLVAVLVAGIAGLIAISAVQRTAMDGAREQLAQQADLLVSSGADAFLDQNDVPDQSEIPDRVSATLAEQGVMLVRPGDAATEATAILDRAAGAARVQYGGRTYLLEYRPGFTLISKTDRAAVTSQALVRRIFWALLAGLAVAIPAGLVLSHLLARPLRRSSEVATAMSAGRRDLRVPVSGPAEIASVATAVNALADSLAVSESGRQRFLAAVSHELRTPLTAVSGLADALADGLIGPAEVGDVGRTIHAETARSIRMVSDLLDLARVGTSEFTLDLEVVDLAAVVAQLVPAWQARCDSQQVPLTVAGLAHAPALADPRRLRQVLDGLAENAVRLLEPGQSLVFEVFRTGIEVRDGGPGLAAQDYAVAFEPGVLHERYRRERPSGAGLGLALAHGLITRMGGQIEVGPAPEGGVRFVITLPAAASSTEGKSVS